MDAQRRLRATAPKRNFPLKVDRNKSGICTSSLLILYYSFTPMQTLGRCIGKSWYCYYYWTVQGDKCRTVQSVALMLPHTHRNHQLTSSIPPASSSDRPPDQLKVVLILIIESQDFYQFPFHKDPLFLITIFIFQWASAPAYWLQS